MGLSYVWRVSYIRVLCVCVFFVFFSWLKTFFCLLAMYDVLQLRCTVYRTVFFVFAFLFLGYSCAPEPVLL